MEPLLEGEDEGEVDQGGEGDDEGQHQGESPQPVSSLSLFVESVAIFQDDQVLFRDIISCNNWNILEESLKKPKAVRNSTCLPKWDEEKQVGDVVNNNHRHVLPVCIQLLPHVLAWTALALSPVLVVVRDVEGEDQVLYDAGQVS